MAASADSLQSSSTSLLARLWHSSVGKKYVMAITGLGLFGFVIIHLLGNLQIFLGRERINDYAHTLKSNPAILWGARLGLLTIFLLHVIAAIQLNLRNKQARAVGYAVNKPVESTFAQRSIVISGLVILAFVLFHLAHYTLGIVQPAALTHTLNNQHDVYRMMYEGFSQPLISLFYIVSMGLLLLHLSHGVTSLFQSLGLRSKKALALFNGFAKGAALFAFLGNTAMVLAILLGLLPRP